MSLFTDLKERVFQKKLEQKNTLVAVAARAEKSVNIKTAKKLTILFPADRAADRKSVEKWKANDHKPNRKVTLVGYFSKDFGTAEFDFTAISIKENTWYGAPAGEMTKRFLGEDCDLLIRLGPRGHQQLDFLAASKSAELKVGPFDPKLDTPIYQLEFDAQAHEDLQDQLAAIESIFSFTNAKPS